MTPKQRYLFDLTGYIHLKNVLSDEELKNAQDAVERCVQTPLLEIFCLMLSVKSVIIFAIERVPRG